MDGRKPLHGLSMINLSSTSMSTLNPTSTCKSESEIGRAFCRSTSDRFFEAQGKKRLVDIFQQPGTKLLVDTQAEVNGNPGKVLNAPQPLRAFLLFFAPSR